MRFYFNFKTAFPSLIFFGGGSSGEELTFWIFHQANYLSTGVQSFADNKQLPDTLFYLNLQKTLWHKIFVPILKERRDPFLQA